MLAVPYAETVRGYSFFGFSLVYVLFEDGTDLYWARSRVLETLGQVAAMLPEGASPALGPDATGVGWAYIYALKSDRHDLSELRSLQDWFLRFELTGIPGVAEVATVGGFVRQYQIAIDPLKLRAYGIPISRIKEAVQSSNRDVGGRLIELAEKEFMIRGRGYIESIDDIRKVSLGTPTGTARRCCCGTWRESRSVRRSGEAWRSGTGRAKPSERSSSSGTARDTREVVRRVTDRLEELKPQLPEGVSIEVAYDRTALIDRVIESLRSSLTQQFVIVGVVCLLFLFHVLSGIVAVLTIVVGVLVAGIAAALLGVHLDIMSLGGVAVAVGTMVDAGIVMVENAHQHMARGRRPQAAWGDPSRLVPGGRADALLLPADHYGLVPARVRPPGGGRASVSPARLDQDAGHGRRGPARGYACAGPRQPRCSQFPPSGPTQSGPHAAGLVLPARAGDGDEAPGDHSGGGGGGALRFGFRLPKAGIGIHASPLGGRPAVHADNPAGGLHRQGEGAGPADQQDHHDLP